MGEGQRPKREETEGRELGSLRGKTSGDRFGDEIKSWKPGITMVEGSCLGTITKAPCSGFFNFCGNFKKL